MSDEPTSTSSGPEFDTRDVDRWIGVPLGGASMKDEVHVNDIRRWVQGMQNPNPIYYDEECAEAGRGQAGEQPRGPQSRFVIEVRYRYRRRDRRRDRRRVRDRRPSAGSRPGPRSSELRRASP